MTVGPKLINKIYLHCVFTVCLNVNLHLLLDDFARKYGKQGYSHLSSCCIITRTARLKSCNRTFKFRLYLVYFVFYVFSVERVSYVIWLGKH